MRVWAILVRQRTRALEGNQSAVPAELASGGGIEVNNESRPCPIICSSHRRTPIDNPQVGWGAALSRHVCNVRQVAGLEIHRQRVDRPSSVCFICYINFRRNFSRLYEPGGAPAR